MASTRRIVGSVNRAVAQVLSEQVKKSDIRHEDLGSESGIPRSSLSKLLSGSMVMSLDQLFSICDALEIKASTVIAEAEHRLKARKGRTHTPNTVEQPSLSHLLSLAADEREISVEDDDEAAAWTP